MNGLLFAMIQGSLERNDLMCVKYLNKFMVNDENFPEEEELKKYLKSNNMNEEYVYYNPNGFFNKYVYWDENGFYLELISISEEASKTMQIKERFEKGKEFFEKLKEEKNYEKMFNYMEKITLLNMYFELYSEIPNELKYDIFVSIYSRLEYGFEKITKDKFKEIASYNTNKEELKQKMKEKSDHNGYIKIYRGEASKSNSIDEAYSWTLDYKMALFFAKRFEGKGNIYEGLIHYEDVLGYLTGRGEEEIWAIKEDIINIEKQTAN